MSEFDPTMQNMSQTKRALRSTMRVMRREHHDGNLWAAGRVRDFIMSLFDPGAIPGRVLSGYVGQDGEIDPMPLLKAAREVGFDLALPVQGPRDLPLSFRSYAPEDDLISSAWKIMEPGQDAPVVDPDILIVPVIAFDRTGMRLGYGGGYYDRTLAALRLRKSVLAIGIAYAAQEVNYIPCAPHDQRLDIIVTEKSIAFRKTGALPFLA